MVADTGTVGFTDDEAQTILDSYRVDLYRHEMGAVAVNIGGTTNYLTHIVGYGDLETVASGTSFFQVWDVNGGTIGTADYTADYQRGILRLRPIKREARAIWTGARSTCTARLRTAGASGLALRRVSTASRLTARVTTGNSGGNTAWRWLRTTTPWQLPALLRYRLA